MIKINSDAAVAICLGYPAFIKNKIGLKNMPPPIPTIPEKNPITDPINIEMAISIFIGSVIGFFSGIVGIGGGIFLSPILFLMKAGYPRHIATAASLFILINSIFGIAGQLTKNIVFEEFLNYWPLFVCVLVGGQIGNLLNIKLLSNKTLTIITSMLVIFVSIRMGLRLIP